MYMLVGGSEKFCHYCLVAINPMFCLYTNGIPLQYINFIIPKNVSGYLAGSALHIPAFFFTLWCLCVSFFYWWTIWDQNGQSQGSKFHGGMAITHLITYVWLHIPYHVPIPYFPQLGLFWKCGIPHRLVVLMVNLMLFNWNWGHGFTSCIFSHMFSTFSPYPLVIKHSYGSWIYGWFSWGSTMKNNDFDHVGGSWNRGTPKSSKSLEHFSIETSGDLGIPHDFGNLHIYIYICHIFSYSFPKFSPTCFPNFPHIISPYHLNGTIPRSCARWSKSSPGPCVPAASASGVTAIRWARRWRWRPLVVVPSWDDDVLYIYMCVCIYVFLCLLIYLFIYMCICIYRFNIYIYIHTYIYLYLLFFIYTHIYIYI